MSEIKNKERREFLAKAAVAGVAIGAGTNLFGAANKQNIACKGWAALGILALKSLLLRVRR